MAIKFGTLIDERYRIGVRIGHGGMADVYEANDIIAKKTLGDATYSWIIAYFNKIEDGYTVQDGQVLMIPNSITTLFKTGEILQSISPNLLNLGEE